MATVTETYYADDTAPTLDANFRVRFEVNGIVWELDLSRDNHDEFNADMRKWTQHARKVGGQRIEPKPLKGRKFSVEDEDERKQIRAWAKANGKDVSEYGGRLADDYIKQYCEPNRPDRRNTMRSTAVKKAVQPVVVDEAVEEGLVEAAERSIKGQMTPEGWFYESFGDAETVAKEMGRYAIRKDGGGLVVIELGVSYQQSLKELADKEKAARGAKGPAIAAAKTNKNATRAVLRKLTAEVSMWNTAIDSMSLDTKEVFVQQAKAWLGDNTELSHKTLETADWDAVYEHALSTQQDEVEASAEVGLRTEPAGTVEIQEIAGSVVAEPKSGRRTKAAPRTGTTEKKPTTKGTKAKPAGGDSVKPSRAAARTTRTRRQPAAASTGT